MLHQQASRQRSRQVTAGKVSRTGAACRSPDAALVPAQSLLRSESHPTRAVAAVTQVPPRFVGDQASVLRVRPVLGAEARTGEIRVFAQLPPEKRTPEVLAAPGEFPNPLPQFQ